MDEVRRKIEADRDFIDCPQYSNSLTSLIEKSKDGKTFGEIAICKYLHMTRAEYKKVLESGMRKLREHLVGTDEDLENEGE